MLCPPPELNATQYVFGGKEGWTGPAERALSRLFFCRFSSQAGRNQQCNASPDEGAPLETNNPEMNTFKKHSTFPHLSLGVQQLHEQINQINPVTPHSRFAARDGARGHG